MKYIKIAVIIAFILSLGVFIASKVREIQSADETLPEITSDRKLLEIPCDYTRDQLLEGLTAYDDLPDCGRRFFQVHRKGSL